LEATVNQGNKWARTFEHDGGCWRRMDASGIDAVVDETGTGGYRWSIGLASGRTLDSGFALSAADGRAAADAAVLAWKAVA
jgi:hypothetical protein